MIKYNIALSIKILLYVKVTDLFMLLEILKNFCTNTPR